MDPNRAVSAQVKVVSTSTEGDAAGPVTTENVRARRPHPEEVETALRAFESAGFEVGFEVGGTFSVTARPERFEEFFGTELTDGPGGTVLAKHPDAHTHHVLPLAALPPRVAALVDVVTFSPPTDFGPGSF